VNIGQSDVNKFECVPQLLNHPDIVSRSLNGEGKAPARYAALTDAYSWPMPVNSAYSRVFYLSLMLPMMQCGSDQLVLLITYSL
jgi:hypothetical protein